MTDTQAARGKLYVVGTPIGNLADLSERAREALAGADVIAAEDTRRTRGLLLHIRAETHVLAYHEHNERERVPDLLDRLARGATVALVSDAGTPLISDPGWRLVHAAPPESTSCRSRARAP
jgi:16S rRNA (cytidine1402-2'-O)-methyltransferase